MIDLSGENEKRAKEFEDKLAEHEAQEAAEKAEVERCYNPREACRKSSEIRVVHDEVLGDVHFGVLSYKEFTDLKLSEIEDPNARVCKVIHAMLAKADPQLTLEQVQAVPFDDFTILNRILGESLPGFLQLAKQVLKSGSRPTQTLRSSG